MSLNTTIPIRIYYEDTDFSGMVYHANYLKYFERGRTESLRHTGLNHADLLDLKTPMAFTVRRMQLDFLKPARIDNILEVRTSIANVKGAQMIFEQEIWRGEDRLITATVDVVAITMAGRPKRLPPEIVDYFKAHEIK